jgi:hypothetical protein
VPGTEDTGLASSIIATACSAPDVLDTQSFRRAHLLGLTVPESSFLCIRRQLFGCLAGWPFWLASFGPAALQKTPFRRRHCCTAAKRAAPHRPGEKHNFVRNYRRIS